MNFKEEGDILFATFVAKMASAEMQNGSKRRRLTELETVDIIDGSDSDIDVDEFDSDYSPSEVSSEECSDELGEGSDELSSGSDSECASEAYEISEDFVAGDAVPGQFAVDLQVQRPVVRGIRDVRGRMAAQRHGIARPNQQSILDAGWSKYEEDDPDFEALPFTVPHPGFQVSVNRRPQNSLDYFQLFFTDELLSEIVQETNRFAREKIQKTRLKKFSVWHDWTEVTLVDMKAFLGVLLNMGLNPKTYLKEYWSEEWVNRMPFFKDVFGRTRFLQIFWMLHLCPPTVPNGIVSRGNKVKNVVDYLDRKFREHFIPGKNIAVDESTVGFKGRVIFKCYNPKKPTKWGLRIYVLADSSTGYVSAIVPYYGKPTTDSLIRPELAFTERIVLHLCSTLLETTNGAGYHLFTDRFYTGVQLAEELLKLNIQTTGTIMSNRKGLPSALKRKPKVNLHEVLAFRKDDKVMALLWRDKRFVFMLSTFHNIKQEIVNRPIRRGVIEELSKPVVILDYTQHMGAVDRADHYCSSYAFIRKSYKWWRKLFFWLLEVSIVNSFILMNISRTENRLKPLEHKQFRRQLIQELVGNVRNPNSGKRGRPSSTDDTERLNGKPHFVQKNPKDSTKDCAVCSNRKICGGRRETVWICETCTRKPGLHPGECFKKYHTKLKYK